MRLAGGSSPGRCPPNCWCPIRRRKCRIVGAVTQGGEGPAVKVRVEPMHKQLLSMHQSPRCGARTRRGSPCRSPAVKGRRRCRMHGGAPGSGAQPGNRNALKHGRYTRELIEFRRTYASCCARAPAASATTIWPEPALLLSVERDKAYLVERLGLVIFDRQGSSEGYTRHCSTPHRPRKPLRMSSSGSDRS